MKLATLDNGTRDGRFVIVSRDHSRAVPADCIAATSGQRRGSHSAFRESAAFQTWRSLVGSHFDNPPRVEHLERVIDGF